MSTESRANNITSAEVIAYLTENPEFFATHTDVVDQLNIPHESGDAVSLLQHQVNVLRGRNTEFHSRLDQLLEHARDNDRKFAQTRRFVLHALDATSFKELNAGVERSLYDDFGVEYCALVLLRETPVSGVRTCRILEANRHISSILTSSKAVCGQFSEAELNWIFGHNKVKSAAITPIAHGQQYGILAVGNSDPAYYRSGMGTLFLNYVSEVLARVIPAIHDDTPS